MDVTTADKSIPSAIPTKRETIIKAIKAFSLNWAIRRKSSAIPRITMTSGIRQAGINIIFGSSIYYFEPDYPAFTLFLFGNVLYHHTWQSEGIG